MKNFIHAAVGSFVLGAIMAAIGFPFGTWQYWAVLVPVIVWYFTKPEDN